MVVKSSSEGPRLCFTGRMDASGVTPIWKKAMAEAEKKEALVVDLTGVEYLDGAGVGLLLDLRRITVGEIKIEGISKEFETLLEPFESSKLPESLDPPKKAESLPVYLGQIVVALLKDLREQIAFTGQILLLLTGLFFNPASVRWSEVWITFQKVGNNALVIVGLIGFLMGMIMAFQSAVPLRQFGVDIFVVNLVALAMFRELGPIMTAIVVAGRSGSAFAAEIGTMKVNEEIDALTTMGLQPARLLVLPRVLAGIFATPILTIYANAIGIFGGMFVVSTFGHSWASIWTQLVGSVAVSDVLTGMIKSVVFGLLISCIGCLRGLQTQSGALAVGMSTTRAVVSSIVLIIFTDGIFAVVFYIIGF